MEIKLYNRNLSSPTFVEDLTYKHQRLKFSTKLHGGFYTCSFMLKADLPAAWTWITDKMFFRLLITDGADTLWEGRVEDVGITQGSVQVTAYGYYSNLGDIPYSTAFNDNADVVIKAILTAACTQISSDQSNIAATGGPAITSTANAGYLDIYPKDLIEKLLDFSDTTYDSKWYFGIWEDRIPYLVRQNVTSADWRVTLADFNRFRLKHRAADLWNSVYAVYDDSGLTRTADASDATSKAKYGDGTTDFERKKVISDLGTVVATTAQSARDGWLEDHKNIWPRLENIVLGSKVFDVNGIPKKSYLVRAGEVIRVRDLVPVSSDLDTVERDALRTYYIVETEYDMDSATLRITPDTENMSLDAILARKI